MISTTLCQSLVNILTAVFIFWSAESFCQADITNTSDKPVRLVMTPETITFDGKPLSFEKPLKEWIHVLGKKYTQGQRGSVGPYTRRRFIYPDLGIDLEVQGNNKDPKSDWVNGEVGTLNDPMNRYVVDVRIRLNPKNEIAPPRINEKKYENHPYNTMFADYAINFYGAIVDRSVKKEQIIKYGEGVAMDRHFNSVDARISGNHNATIIFEHFFGKKPEVPVMLEIYPSSKLKYKNELKYFGKVVSR